MNAMARGSPATLMHRRFRALSRTASALTIVVASLVIVAWTTDAPALEHVLVPFRNMAFTTALCFVLAGIALASGGLEPRTQTGRWILRGCAAALLAFGGAVVAEHAWDGDATRLFHPLTIWSFPGASDRPMALAAAVNFTLFGLALWLGAKPGPVGVRQTLACVVGISGLVTVLGYTYSVEALYAFEAPMALLSGVLFWVLAIAFLFARPDQGWMAVITSDTQAGTLARRLLPLALILPIATRFLAIIGHRQGLYSAGLGAALLGGSTIFLFTFAVLWAVRRIEIHERTRRRAEEAVRASEVRYELAARATSDAIWDWDFETNELRWNPGIEILFGYPHTEVPSTISWWHTRIHAEDRERRLSSLHAVIASDRTFWREEYRLQRADGSFADVLDRGYVARDHSGKPVRMIGAIQDLTERKRAERALRRSEAQFRAVFERAAVGVARVGFTDARWIDVNDTFCRMLGYSAAEMRATSWPEMTHPDDVESDLIPFRRMAAGELDSYTIEKRFIHKRGHPVWARLTLSVVHGDDGKPAYEVAVIEDISERKQAEAQLRGAREELARVNRELERKVQERTQKLEETIRELEGFSYSLVHDLRAPLRAIAGYASVVEQDVPNLEPATTTYIRRIRAAAQRMDQLISDSLNYAKVVREDLPLGLVDVGRLLRDIIDTYPQLHASGAAVVLEFESLLVWGNEATLTQIFSNLLSNAVKFVAPGVTPRVRIWSGPDGTTTPPQARAAPPPVQVYIEDNGIGIPPEAHERIFGMFQRLHRADEYPGTGIGLAIVRKSLARIGGHIHLSSAPGQGTRFCVALPPPPDDAAPPRP